jgi:hypothetical protein
MAIVQFNHILVRWRWHDGEVAVVGLVLYNPNTLYTDRSESDTPVTTKAAWSYRRVFVALIALKMLWAQHSGSGWAMQT